jgi:hypothetical protein
MQVTHPTKEPEFTLPEETILSNRNGRLSMLTNQRKMTLKVSTNSLASISTDLSISDLDSQ